MRISLRRFRRQSKECALSSFLPPPGPSPSVLRPPRRLAAGLHPLAASALAPAVLTKRQIAHKLMQQNPAFFAIGVGQSLDNPREAALVIYVDRQRIPAQLPSAREWHPHPLCLHGSAACHAFLRAAFPAPRHCMPHAAIYLRRRRPIHAPPSRSTLVRQIVLALDFLNQAKDQSDSPSMHSESNKSTQN